MSGAYIFDETSASAVEALTETADEGELPVDVAETEDLLVITAPVAGADPEHITIHLNGDVLTIRGQRERALPVTDEHFFSEECFWGSFSRSIILPVDVRVEDAHATYKNGLLTIAIPKQSRTRHIPIIVIDE